MPRKNPLPESELAIGRRLMELRAMANLSRAELVKLCPVRHDLVSRVELGRMPLRYGDAERLLPWLAAPGPIPSPINPLWLAYGTWPIQLEWPFLLPKPDSIGLSYRTRFSAFVASHRKLLEGLTKEPPEADLPESWIVPYAVYFATLRGRLARMERGVAWLRGLWEYSAEQFESKSPKIARILRDVLGRKQNSERKLLRELVLKDMVSEVMTLATLRHTLKSFTSGYGEKAKLARWLKVPGSSVSAWIAGTKEPGGETTLKLLTWIEKQKEKQQNAASVLPPAAPKIRKTHISYETRKSNRPKG
jgi:transcriptional regulator with XRE-family HTH domain